MEQCLLKTTGQCPAQFYASCMTFDKSHPICTKVTKYFIVAFMPETDAQGPQAESIKLSITGQKKYLPIFSLLPPQGSTEIKPVSLSITLKILSKSAFNKTSARLGCNPCVDTHKNAPYRWDCVGTLCALTWLKMLTEALQPFPSSSVKTLFPLTVTTVKQLHENNLSANKVSAPVLARSVKKE